MWSLRAAGATLCVLGLTAFTNGLYYIDDQDSSITYNSSAGVGYNKKWLKYSHENSNLLAVSVNETFLFDKTASYTQCYPSDHCSITIPFNGTGITLYVAQDIGDIYNTTISLDNGPATNHFAYNDIKAQVEAYNATLYDIQGLNWTTHTVRVELDPSGSRLLFDYAAVAGDQPPGRNGAAAAAAASLLAVAPVLVLLGVSFW
ncbi:hypothetical protein DFH08DRAFT_856730 [Mycena albidolilacea]|uniref:Uncharacterized protein n=1 Tax=Mycena albidolilacea TaxID=1033008 RepID=A0AAD7AA97_9AGAR|nr:hypothetical protein DFH08DRAFT_856730 [Mycena albidolilacea]